MTTDVYRDGQEREMAKWAHDRTRREREAREAEQRLELNNIYDGYYPNEED